MTNNKKIAIFGGVGVAAALAVGAVFYAAKEEPEVVKTPAECMADAATKASEKKTTLSLEIGQSVMELTTDSDIKGAATELRDCISRYADSQKGFKFTFGQ